MPTSDPWDGTTWDVTAPDTDQPAGNAFKEIFDLRKGIGIRINKEHETLASSSAGGVHKQGSARCFFQDAAPTTQVNGDAFDSGDLGSLWIDSNSSPDNQFNILTATTPTWTPISVEIIAVLLASARVFGDALTVTGLLTANGGVTLGDGDDLIGSATSDIMINTDKFTVAGATGNALVGGTLDVVGNIDPTSYETTRGGFLDEDAMGSDAADKVASQQSIKARIASQIAGDTAVLVDSESDAMVFGHAYLAQTSGFVNAQEGNDTDLALYVGATDDPAGAGVQVSKTLAAASGKGNVFGFVPNGKYFEVVCAGTLTSIVWTPLVAGGGAPIDQD